MRPRRLLERLNDGHLRDATFRDVLKFAEALGFRVSRVRGSHHILTHERIHEQLNLQDAGGEAKPYQIRQLLDLIRQYDLELR
ncbi:MAG: type II toxin-antitoxin system HicA family toxin [Acidimicrobiia bacterium]|nr:MAG: type II toxin-antitoxin system HicA family toxin [Acidimicrobiia bacterium]